MLTDVARRPCAGPCADQITNGVCAPVRDLARKLVSARLVILKNIVDIYINIYTNIKIIYIKPFINAFKYLWIL